MTAGYSYVSFIFEYDNRQNSFNVYVLAAIKYT